MADRQDISIEIYGRLDSVESCVKLAAAMIEDGVKPNFEDDIFDDTYEVLQHFVLTARKQDPLFCVRTDTAEGMRSVRDACREIGLSYRAHFHQAPGLREMICTWAPKFDKEAIFSSANGKIQVPLTKLVTARAGGETSMAAFVDDLVDKSLANGLQTLKMEGDLMTALENWEEEPEEAPAPAPASPGMR
jgi:hypothetical protein